MKVLMWPLLALLWMTNVGAQETVEAYWTRYSVRVHAPNWQICSSVRQAVNPLLNGLNARNVRMTCSQNSGAWINFEALSQYNNSGPVILAEWRLNQVTSFFDSRNCYYAMNAIEEIVAQVEIRDLQYQVMCNDDTAYSYFRFESMVPVDAQP